MNDRDLSSGNEAPFHGDRLSDEENMTIIGSAYLLGRYGNGAVVRTIMNENDKALEAARANDAPTADVERLEHNSHVYHTLVNMTDEVYANSHREESIPTHEEPEVAAEPISEREALNIELREAHRYKARVIRDAPNDISALNYAEHRIDRARRSIDVYKQSQLAEARALRMQTVRAKARRFFGGLIK